MNFFKDYSPGDGGDVIKLIHAVYKSFSEHIMDAARRRSLTVRPEVPLNLRLSSLRFHTICTEAPFSRARAFAVRKTKHLAWVYESDPRRERTTGPRGLCPTLREWPRTDAIRVVRVLL